MDANEKDSIEGSATDKKPLPDTKDGDDKKTPQKLIRLSAADRAVVLHDLAGVATPTGNSSSQDTVNDVPIQILSTSLYGSVIHSRKKTEWRFQALSLFHNLSLVIQLVFGAVLTALSGAKSKHEVALTVLAAIQTINAGLLALLHNSGLPERVKNDFREFEKVEQHIKALVDTGIVRSDWSREEVIADCWDRYALAKDIVGKNKPTNYNGTDAEKASKTPGTIV